MSHPDPTPRHLPLHLVHPVEDLLEGADDAPLQPLVGDGHLAHLRLHRPQLGTHGLDTPTGVGKK